MCDFILQGRKRRKTGRTRLQCCGVLCAWFALHGQAFAWRGTTLVSTDSCESILLPTENTGGPPSLHLFVSAVQTEELRCSVCQHAHRKCICMFVNSFTTDTGGIYSSEISMLSLAGHRILFLHLTTLGLMQAALHCALGEGVAWLTFHHTSSVIWKHGRQRACLE